MVPLEARRLPRAGERFVEPGADRPILPHSERVRDRLHFSVRAMEAEELHVGTSTNRTSTADITSRGTRLVAPSFLQGPARIEDLMTCDTEPHALVGTLRGETAPTRAGRSGRHRWGTTRTGHRRPRGYGRSMSQPPQHQDPPGLQSAMTPVPDCGDTSYVGHCKLDGKAAVATGADSGIGRAVAIAFTRKHRRVAAPLTG